MAMSTWAACSTHTQHNEEAIEAFMQEEASRYERGGKASIEVRLGQPIAALPPALPRERNALKSILWSLHMRWWSYRNG